MFIVWNFSVIGLIYLIEKKLIVFVENVLVFYVFVKLINEKKINICYILIKLNK